MGDVKVLKFNKSKNSGFIEEEIELNSVNLKFVSNGIILTFLFADNTEMIEVHESLEQVLSRLSDSIGAYNEE